MPVEIALVAVSTYNDPFAREWHPDLRYTAAFLRRHGLETEFLYLPAPETPDEVLEHWRGAEPLAIFLDVTEENRGPLRRLIARLDAAFPRAQIIVGGIAASLAPGELLRQQAAIDLVACGERELTLLETVRRMKAGRDLRGVQGLQSRDFRQVPRPLIDDLDTLGNMVHDGIDQLLDGMDERVGYLLGSRGCYGNCTFCGVPGFYRQSPGKPWRGRSPEAIVRELRDLAIKFQVRHFVFQDDNFVGPGRAGQERARDIARGILESGLQITYSACCRLNDIRRDTLELLKQSGLNRLGVSIESTNQESLDLLGKGIRAETVPAALGMLEELELPCEVNLIFFEPYLTLSGVRSNLALLEYVGSRKYLSYSDAFPFNELKPFSWSPVATRLRSEGLLDEKTYTCRFRDPGVAQLAAFVRQLRERTQLTFKKRLLFDACDLLSLTDTKGQAISSLLRLSAGLRRWVGLSLMPRFVRAACEVVEHGQDTEALLAGLIAQFDDELEPVRALEHRFCAALQGEP